MSLVISGNADNVTAPLAATIVGMADNGSGATRVQTSSPHHFATDDYVHIVTITTVIDSYFTIEVIDTTHFDLVGSTFTGTGTGTATNASLTPQIQVPTDGDTASLQLSGMLSSIQALADRTQFLARGAARSALQVALVTTSSTVVVPPWSTHILLFGWGGGGGGGGGCGGLDSGAGNFQYAAGGGGAGSQLGTAFALLFNATRLNVSVGTGGAGGSGGAGGTPPGNGTGGVSGGTTIVEYDDGLFPGSQVAAFRGGAGGGRSFSDVVAVNTGTPVFTLGGQAGPGTHNRSPLQSKQSRFSPGPKQLANIINISGALSVAGGDWPAGIYNDPIGQMDYGEGGAAMANAGNATYAAAESYEGAPSTTGFSGGSPGTVGADDGIYLGGGAGAGGGAGPFANGRPGGDGGDGAASGTAGNGIAGGSGSGGGSGGGGGGAGGTAGAGTAGTGGAGGAGGAGGVYIVFLTSQ